MAEEELAEINAEPIAEPMDLQSNAKRARDEAEAEAEAEAEVKADETEAEAKKQKVEEPVRVELGPKTFGSSVEMFDYFYKFLHYWPPNINLNKYEHMVLLELVKKGHAEAESKIGRGVGAFQVRYHPAYKSRCFFLVRSSDGSSDDFSFRKCVDRILPLPDNMKVRPDANRALGRGGGRRFGGKSRD